MAIHHQGQRQHAQRRCRRRHAAALGAARRARHDRHEVRLRHGAVRRLHRACRRRRRRAPASPRSTASAPPRSRPSRRSARRRRAPRSRRPGSTARSCNAATASRARSCRLRRCSRAIRIRPMPTSTTRCPATSAAAGPMCASAKRSSRPRNRTGRRLTMIIGIAPIACSRPGSADTDLSRRAFLQVGAAAGGGLMLSLRLPLRPRRSRWCRRLRAERLHPHRAATARSS